MQVGKLEACFCKLIAHKEGIIHSLEQFLMKAQELNPHTYKGSLVSFVHMGDKVDVFVHGSMVGLLGDIHKLTCLKNQGP